MERETDEAAREAAIDRQRKCRADIGIEVGIMTVAGIRADYRRTVKEIKKLQDELEPKPKKKRRYRARTWWPDG